MPKNIFVVLDHKSSLAEPLELENVQKNNRLTQRKFRIDYDVFERYSEVEDYTEIEHEMSTEHMGMLIVIAPEHDLILTSKSDKESLLASAEEYQRIAFIVPLLLRLFMGDFENRKKQDQSCKSSQNILCGLNTTLTSTR